MLLWFQFKSEHLSQIRLVQTEFSCKTEGPPDIRKGVRQLKSDWEVTQGTRQIWQIWHFHQSGAFKSWQTWERMDTKQPPMIIEPQSWLRELWQKSWLRSNKSSFCRQVPFHWRSPSVIIALLPQARRPAAACEHIISDISDWSESFPPLLQTVTISDIQYPGVNIDCTYNIYHFNIISHIRFQHSIQVHFIMKKICNEKFSFIHSNGY